MNPTTPFEKWTYDMLFQTCKLIGIRGYYRMRKTELVETLYDIIRNPQRVPRTLTRFYYKKIPYTDMEEIPRRNKCIHGRGKYYCKECKELRVGGGGICEHGRQKYVCRDCGGADICDHGIAINTCNICYKLLYERNICYHGLAFENCK